MEQRTILEELLDRSPDKVYTSKLETAFRLSSKGKYDEAAALFDELLEIEPNNTEAASGKKLNERRRSLDNRINSLGERRREEKPPAKERSSESGIALLRSKKVLTAIVIAFVIVCAIAVAVIGIGIHESELDELDGTAAQLRTAVYVDCIENVLK